MEESSALTGNRSLFSRGLVVGSSRRCYSPDPDIEFYLVWTGVRLSASRRRSIWCRRFCAFIRSPRWVELPGGGDIRDEFAFPNRPPLTAGPGSTVSLNI